MRFNHLQPN